MMPNFEDKVVWITGASSGIGEALAYAFAKAGAKLILSSRNEVALQQVKANCQTQQKILILPLDVTEYHLMPKKTAVAIREFGHIDLLINNAGISQRAYIKDCIFEVDQEIMAVNYLGAVALTKAVLPHMLEKGSGHVVAISSVMGKFGAPLRSAYSASKHALHGFFDAFHAELGPLGIDSTIICGGYVRTRVTINALTGNGAKSNQMSKASQNGMLPEEFALKALKAIARKKKETWIGRREIWSIYLNLYFPRLMAFLIQRITPG